MKLYTWDGKLWYKYKNEYYTLYPSTSVHTFSFVKLFIKKENQL